MLDSLLSVQTSIQLLKFASLCVNLPGEVAELGVYTKRAKTSTFCRNV
jgi:hypothetical protein